jgi:antibiotic biosynthesis monooxygenase (ABM) superfamily enzyme
MKMAWIRRDWTPEAADHWSREDWIAAALSVASYLTLILGSALTLLAQPLGYLILGASLVTTLLLYYVIDPKLRAVSTDYESKQKEYLARIEGLTRWKRPE